MNNIQEMVMMSGLSSAQCLLQEGGEPVRVLRDINLRIGCAQSWGITARSAYEIGLLLEIMGNIRPYEGGKCVLMERGMMRKKRAIQEQTFYIGEQDMLYGNMHTLEYLMFATTYIDADRLGMQEELLDLLIELGLGYCCLTGIRWLSREEKAVIALIAALYSDSLLIVCNFQWAVFENTLGVAIEQLVKRILERGKTVVIGTTQHTLIQSVCSHTAFVADGSILYQGTVDRLRSEFDLVTVILHDPDIAAVKSRLTSVLADCLFIEKEGCLLMKGIREANTPAEIFRRILDAGVMPQEMCVNDKNVEFAYEELLRQHDLSQQLF